LILGIERSNRAAALKLQRFEPCIRRVKPARLLCGRLISGEITMSHEQIQTCIEACIECARKCTEFCNAYRHDRKVLVCVFNCRDCSDLCELCVRGLESRSRVVGALCFACAAACDLCVAAFVRFESEPARQCTEACRRCSAECRTLAAKIATTGESLLFSGNEGSKSITPR
jgi:hypothetical protein